MSLDNLTMIKGKQNVDTGVCQISVLSYSSIALRKMHD